jgi:hypothetical protein
MGMSDDHAKTVDPRPFNWGTPEKIFVFSCVNLLAAYAPWLAVVWVTNLYVPESSKVVALLFSPVAFPVIVIDPLTTAGAWFSLFFLAAFIILLFWASVAWRNSLVAWITIPGLVFVSSLLQGMLLASFISGLNALG